MSRTLAALVLALTLAACGSRVDLSPQAGHVLPPAPYGRDERLTAVELLERAPQAAPERNVELRRRSEERADDPFDIPPDEPIRQAADKPAGKPMKTCPPAAAEPDPLARTACVAAPASPLPG